MDNRRRNGPGSASARVEEASEQGTSPLHPRAPGRRHLPRPSLQWSSPARSRRRTPIAIVPPGGRPGKLSPARGSSARTPSCRVVDGASFGAPFEVSLWAMNLELTLVFRKVPEGYIGFVEELPGANSQGETLDEVRANLEEAVMLVLEANRTLSEQEIGGAEVIRETITTRT